jgi:hypothetical protein
MGRRLLAGCFWGIVAIVASCTGVVGDDTDPEVPQGGGVATSCEPDEASVCDDGNPCTDDSCDATSLTCVNDDVADAILTDQTAGDCVIALCVGGVLVGNPDDADFPEDGNPCTFDVCNDGILSNLPLVGGTLCGVDLVCDGAGVCTGCATGADCPPAIGICEAATCIDGRCGLGGVAADGTSCPGDGVFCNGAEVCNAGNCVSPGDPCPGPDGDDDCAESCNESSDTCSDDDPSGSQCDDGVYCNGTDECNPQGNCSQHSNAPCPSVGDSNCANGCDEANQNCNINEPSGSPCSDGQYCNGNDSCNSNGSCSNHAGNPCPGADGDSDCSETCNENANNCSANDPNGSECNGIVDTICCSAGSCITNGGC